MSPPDTVLNDSAFENRVKAAYNARPPALDRSVWMDAFFKNLTRFFAFFVFSILAAILVSLLYHSQLSLAKFGFDFLFVDEWDPVKEEFGALVPIFGTLVSSAIAMLIGIPVSFGIALFLTELSPAWLKRPLGTAIEMLAAIPSIIYGMWGLFVFAPLFGEYVQPLLVKALSPLPGIGMLFKGPAMGIGMLTSGIILAVMVIPFITAVMRDVFELVPAMFKESAYGLGATTWEVVWNVVLPYTKIGVVGGIMLGLGEERLEVHQVMDDMRSADIDFITIGQYLQPTRKHAAIDRFVTPDEFKGYETIAYAKGFLMVAATPLTRSSHHAGDDFAKLRAARAQRG